MTRGSLNRLGLLPAAFLCAALASCGAGPGATGEEPTTTPEPTGVEVSVEYLTVGTAATWQVSVLNPDPLPDASCGEDESVESSMMSLDMPSSHVNYSLRETATEDDAQRVAECLIRVLDAGSITVAPPAAG